MALAILSPLRLPVSPSQREKYRASEARDRFRAYNSGMATDNLHQEENNAPYEEAGFGKAMIF